MKRICLAAMMVALMSSGAAHAGGMYLGQTGQYHLVPSNQDLQYMTLVGQLDATCSSGLTLFAVDEFGKIETTPFVVPSQTVFLLTDAIFRGFDNNPFGQNASLSPWLNIIQSNSPTAFDKASFIATKPLSGKLGEEFVGQGSLESGVAYPVNSKLCAYMSFYPQSAGSNLVLDNGTVVVHGKIVTNYRTNAAPYFSW